MGRRSTLWHGDVNTARRQILREPPDCLLTTPESLEVMLVSASVDARACSSNLRVVIVDEIHAFAGDDRGWHLLRLCWSGSRGSPAASFSGSACRRRWETRRRCSTGWRFLPRATSRRSGPRKPRRVEAEVKLDYVGSLENAAVVISRLHRGEKRLVFVDSRARARSSERSCALDVTTFVTHSSLSQEQRRQAEDAFANRDDCVIVATSVLELGIDVGNLDRVIQIDAPPRCRASSSEWGAPAGEPGSPATACSWRRGTRRLVQAAG